MWFATSTSGTHLEQYSSLFYVFYNEANLRMHPSHSLRPGQRGGCESEPPAAGVRCVRRHSRGHCEGASTEAPGARPPPPTEPWTPAWSYPISRPWPLGSRDSLRREGPARRLYAQVSWFVKIIITQIPFYLFWAFLFVHMLYISNTSNSLSNFGIW